MLQAGTPGCHRSHQLILLILKIRLYKVCYVVSVYTHHWCLHCECMWCTRTVHKSDKWQVTLLSFRSSRYSGASSCKVQQLLSLFVVHMTNDLPEHPANITLCDTFLIPWKFNTAFDNHMTKILIMAGTLRALTCAYIIWHLESTSHWWSSDVHQYKFHSQMLAMNECVTLALCMCTGKYWHMFSETSDWLYMHV